MEWINDWLSGSRWVRRQGRACLSQLCKASHSSEPHSCWSWQAQGEFWLTYSLAPGWEGQTLGKQLGSPSFSWSVEGAQVSEGWRRTKSVPAQRGRGKGFPHQTKNPQKATLPTSPLRETAGGPSLFLTASRSTLTSGWAKQRWRATRMRSPWALLQGWRHKRRLLYY